MGILNRMRESRASVEDPRVSLASPEAFAIIFGDTFKSAAGVDVTLERALGIPAVWAAVNFISNTIAALPLQLYKSDADGLNGVARSDPLYPILHDVVNEDSVTSFKWRKQAMFCVLTNGRAFTYIERNKARRIANLWPLDPKHVTVRTTDNRTFYDVKNGGQAVAYAATEIIDLPFMLMADGVSHMGPIAANRNALGLAIAMEEYASKFFQGGGVPPLSLQGPMTSEAAMRRATQAVDEAVRRANTENKHVIYMPAGHELKPIAFNPENGQLNEARMFQLLEIARIYNLPPTFLQDLSRSTFSNSEQQDLHFVKHALTPWLELWEQELNAKLLGPRSKSFIEFNVDGLLRGDFKTRMDGYAQAIQNGIRTPDEVRESENYGRKGGAAGGLFVNSTIVPIDKAGASQPGTPGTEGANADEQP